MTEESVWEVLLDRFHQQMTALVEQIQSYNPTIWYELSHHETEAFPFTATASFGREGISGEEDVVVTFSVQHSRQALVVSADISTDKGTILSEAGRETIPLNIPRDEVNAKLLSYTDKLKLLLDRNKDDFQRFLSPRINNT